MGYLLLHFWPYILISSISAIIFVLLNSISIWLTASFINNVLTDFDKIVQSQLEWASKPNLTANEKLKYWTNLFILRDRILTNHFFEFCSIVRDHYKHPY